MKCSIGLMMGVSSPAFLHALGAIELFVLAVVVPLFLALFFTGQKLLKRMVLFALISSSIWGLDAWWWSAAQPQKSTVLAIQQLESSNASANEMRVFETSKNAANVGTFVAVLFAASVCFGSYARPLLEKAKSQLS